MIIYTIVCLLVLFFCSAIVNFTKFKGSREHVYESVISEVVSVHFFVLLILGREKLGMFY